MSWAGTRKDNDENLFLFVYDLVFMFSFRFHFGFITVNNKATTTLNKMFYTSH